MSRLCALRRALVTGGTRGLGAAMAQALADDACEVIVTGRSIPDSVAFPTLCVDFDDADATRSFGEVVQGMHIDVLVNNAGINRVAPFTNIKTQDFDSVMAVNLTSAMILSRAVLPHMRARNWGRIINISSIFGLVSREQRASYSASKFGLIGLTKALAAEVARDGVLVNCVAPGVIDTELTRAVLGDEGMESMRSEIPMRRLGRPNEVSSLVRFLASDESSYISGQVIAIDGGYVSV